MSAHLIRERLRTDLQTPAHMHARSVVRELRDENTALRRELDLACAAIAKQARIIAWQRELLAQSEPRRNTTTQGDQT